MRSFILLTPIDAYSFEKLLAILYANLKYFLGILLSICFKEAIFKAYIFLLKFFIYVF